MSDVSQALRTLNIGQRVAEDERDQLVDYFVETDQFRRILAGQIDIVFGPKGSGKSAIYTSLLDRSNELFDRGITLVAGETLRGTPAFKGTFEGPVSEAEFILVWKLYILALISGVLGDFDVRSDGARAVQNAMADAGLVAGPGGLSGLVRRVKDYVGRLFSPGSLEAGIKLDPATAMPSGFTGKIAFREPSAGLRESGVQTIDDLLRIADDAMTESDLSVWVLFDRLDVAFAESRELEANALRALFRVYQDILALRSISIKIFLRSDIWSEITDTGFREASHIIRAVTLEWTDASLLNLVVSRLLNNADLVSLIGVDPETLRTDARKRREWFDLLVPEQIDTGRNPKTFEWILGRVRDGLGIVAPREVIHVIDQARQRQLQSVEQGDPPADQIFGRAAFRAALPEVSKVRLEQTLYAEYPDLKPYLQALDREKTSQTLESLSELWQLDIQETIKIAKRASEVGFFEARGEKRDPEYWVPFLYRPALRMIQGAAE